jgi:hypothetical protein
MIWAEIRWGAMTGRWEELSRLEASREWEMKGRLKWEWGVGFQSRGDEYIHICLYKVQNGVTLNEWPFFFFFFWVGLGQNTKNSYSLSKSYFSSAYQSALVGGGSVGDKWVKCPGLVLASLVQWNLFMLGWPCLDFRFQISCILWNDLVSWALL